MIDDTQELKSKNTRLTTTKKTILTCLIEQKKPLDYRQIESFLDSRGIKVNKTTIYRQLDQLQIKGIIQELDFGEGKKRYEIISKHHHHLICTACNKIECVNFEEDFNSQEAEISQYTNFRITGHMFEFLGICGKCQNKTGKIKHA